MDDFSSKPGHPNKYGLVGNKANAIEPNKRMLSSMTPTIVENSKGEYYNIDIDRIKKIVTEMISSKQIFSFLI